MHCASLGQLPIVNKEFLIFVKEKIIRKNKDNFTLKLNFLNKQMSFIGKLKLLKMKPQSEGIRDTE